MRRYFRTRWVSGWRVGWLLALVAVQALYFPINQVVQGGIILKTPLDDFIPLWAIWVVPYVFSIAWWFACLFWAAWAMEVRDYQAFILGTMIVVITGHLIYLFFPTYVLRPMLTGQNWDTQWLQAVYSRDRPYNAFPSSHTYHTWLFFLFWRRWHPRQVLLWGGIALVILCSTLFTRQHNLPDVLGGVTLAWLGYRFSLWWVREGKGLRGCR
jgi:hypothetical protein